MVRLAKEQRTGNKNCLMLHARRAQRPQTGAASAASGGGYGSVCLVTVHLRAGDPAAQQALLATALAHASPAAASVVLGGDFNVEARDPSLASNLDPVLARKGLRRLPLPDGDGLSTALGTCPWQPHGSGGYVIDHFYVSKGLSLAPGCAHAAVGPLPPPPLGPFAEEEAANEEAVNEAQCGAQGGAAGDTACDSAVDEGHLAPTSVAALGATDAWNDGSDHAWVMAALVGTD